MSDKEVLFVSWCGLKLLRPRSLQVGRAGKALRAHNWLPSLICSKFENDSYLFDAEIEDWYRPQFVQITALNDPEFDNPPAQAMERPASLLARLKKRLQHSGPPQPWTAAATSAVARWVHRRRRPIVISFAQPWTSHLAVLAAKRDYPGLKWAAHFSDPWVDSPYFTETEIKKRDAARQLEREIIGRADAVVFVTEETADLVMQKYPSDWRRKVRVIPHLLDLSFPLVPEPQHPVSDRLQFVHAGSLYEGTRAPTGLFQALVELKQGHSAAIQPLHFHFVGWPGSRVIQFLSEMGLEDCVSWTEPLYYSRSLKEMADANVLVVIDADFEVSPFLPSKIFDYLLFDRPILGLTPPGSATARFLRQLGYPCAAPNNVKEIKNILLMTIDAWKAGRLKPTAEHIEARNTYDVHAAGTRYIELVEGLEQ